MGLVLTDEGRKSLTDDSQMDDETRLMLVVVAGIDGDVEEDALEDALDGLVETFGSVAGALHAVQNGYVRLWVEGNGD